MRNQRSCFQTCRGRTAMGWAVGVLSLALVAGLLAGCGGDDDDELILVGAPKMAAGTAQIGPAGGTLVSDDGRLVLTVPAGALSAVTTLSASVLNPATLTTDYPVADAYALGPAAQQFAVPVAASLLLLTPPPALGAPIPEPGILLLSSGGTAEPLGQHALVVDDANSRMLLLGELTHFSRLDHSPAQVHIETRFLEVTDSFHQQIGVEWALGPAAPDPTGGVLKGLDATSGAVRDQIDLAAPPLQPGLHPTLLPVGDADSILDAILPLVRLDGLGISGPPAFDLDSFTWLRPLVLTPAVSLDVTFPVLQAWAEGAMGRIQGEILLVPRLSATADDLREARVTLTAEHVDTGETVVLEDLVTDDQGRVPFLSDLPLLGRYLFSTTRVEHRRAPELLILITPHVVELNAE